MKNLKEKNIVSDNYQIVYALYEGQGGNDPPPLLEMLTHQES